MKKILKFSLVLVVVLTTMNVHAGDLDFALNVKKEQGKMVTFALDKMNKTDLSIYEAKDKMIHSEKVDSQRKINRTYDLKALSEETYFLDAESEVFKPVFVNRKGLIWVGLLNLDKSPVNIKVFDKENNEVYDSDVILDQDVKKVFNINQINDEEYTFVMTYKDKTYSKTFASR